MQASYKIFPILAHYYTKLFYVPKLPTVQLRGILIPKCGQWVQHPRTIFVQPVTSMWVPVEIFPVSSKVCQ